MTNIALETVDDCAREESGDATYERHPYLVVILQGDRLTEAGARVCLTGIVEVLIGRGADRCVERMDRTRLSLRLPSTTLSTTHARLVKDGASWAIEDARSRNGTFVNGERVERRVLAENDVIEVGRTFLGVRFFVTAGPPPRDLAEGGVLAREPVGLRTHVPGLAERFRALTRIAASSVPVLILGESGTGKEVLARAVHGLSGRKGEFVAVNCGALPSNLLEAQLFGHTKGAFSGATRDEPGFLRAADKGTLLLDEIGELPKTSQTALLRVLQEGEVVPVGSTRPVRVDTRIVAATNRAIGRLDDSDDSFRSDLYARLAGFTFAAPPLRERKEDIGLLVADILAARLGERASRLRLAPEAALALLQHDWPLNVRELEQALCAAAVLAEDGVLRLAHFPPAIVSRNAVAASQGPAADLSDEDRRLRAEVLARMTEHRGNIAAVARAMNKAPAQIHRWLKRFNIDPHPFRA